MFKGPKLIALIAAAILLITVITFVVYVQVAAGREVVKTITPSAVTVERPFALGETLVAVTPAAQVTPMPGLATMVLSFGEAGTDAGQFTDARTIAVDPQGRIFIGEDGSGHVQIFDPTGKVISEWMIGGHNSSLHGMAVDLQTGSLFISESGSLLRFVRPMVGEMAFRPLDGIVKGSIGDIDTGLDGGLAVTYSGDHMALVDKNTRRQLDLEQPVQAVTGSAETDLRVALDSAGSMYVLGKSSHVVLKYSTQGKFLTRIGEAGNGLGQFRTPSDVSADSQGRVYVSDGERVLIFSSAGKYLGVLQVTGEVYDLATDVQDQLYVLTGAAKVYKFNVIAKP